MDQVSYCAQMYFLTTIKTEENRTHQNDSENVFKIHIIPFSILTHPSSPSTLYDRVHDNLGVSSVHTLNHKTNHKIILKGFWSMFLS